jgi:hypothetical protein
MPNLRYGSQRKTPASKTMQKESSIKCAKTYEYDRDVTGMTDCGVTLQVILSGQT